MTDQIMTDMPYVMTHEHFHSAACRTRALVDQFYLCQTNRMNCEHAFPFGMSYLCCSFKRSEFSKRFE
jgi:hypothetical protein